MKLPKFIKQFLLGSANLIPLSIIAAKLSEIVLRQFNIEFASTTNGYSFAANFIEWFGVLYGILLPLILVRVWEQLDNIDREFDREADAVKLLYEDAHYLKGRNAIIGNEIVKLLRLYVVHVINNFSYESKGSDTARIEGDQILERIRELYRSLALPKRGASREMESFISEIHYEVKDIVEIRADRIALASQRLFSSLRLVALLTSIIFIMPFYFVGLTPASSILDNLLIVGVTLLVMFIYLIIEDFDEPFGGTWKITGESWHRLLENMDSAENKLELEYKSKSLDKKVRSKKRRAGDKRKSPTDILGS